VLLDEVGTGDGVPERVKPLLTLDEKIPWNDVGPSVLAENMNRC
jgi:hypothetical protein